MILSTDLYNTKHQGEIYRAVEFVNQKILGQACVVDNFTAQSKLATRALFVRVQGDGRTKRHHEHAARAAKPAAEKFSKSTVSEGVQPHGKDK